MRIQKASEPLIYCLAWPALARIIKTNTYLLSVRQSSCYIPDHFRLSSLVLPEKNQENLLTFAQNRDIKQNWITNYNFFFTNSLPTDRIIIAKCEWKRKLLCCTIYYVRQLGYLKEISSMNQLTAVGCCCGLGKSIVCNNVTTIINGALLYLL